MKAFALLRDDIGPFSDGISPMGVAVIAGTPVTTGTVEVGQIDFDGNVLVNRPRVLVRVDALSCNYRDKTLLLSYVQSMAASSQIPFSFIGSDFCATVVAVGSDVSRWKVGDRVIPDAHYPEAVAPGVLPGIVTNHAAVGWLVLHEAKLLGIPAVMESVEAAGFSLAAQTSMSMIRRSAITASDRVLVTSARSNTSLVLLAALQNIGAEIWTTSSSSWKASELEHLRGSRLVPSTRGFGNLIPEADATEIAGLGGFTAVLDPFFDLHLERAIDLVAPGGRYVTCGLMSQHPQFESSPDVASRIKWLSPLAQVMMKIVMGNITLIGNCLGQTDDLKQALDLFQQGKLSPLIDSVFDAAQGAEFLRRTFVAPERLGKSVMSYN